MTKKTHKLIEGFHAQTLQRKMLLGLLALVIIFSAYVRFSYKPRAAVLRDLKAHALQLDNQRIRIQSETPNVQKEEEALQADQERYKWLMSELADVEAELPRQGSIPQILGQIARQAEGYPIDLISIKPKLGDPLEEYSRLDVEMIFLADYPGLVNYLYRLEALSQFLKPNEMVMEKMENGFQGRAEIKLTLSTLLGEAIKDQGPAEVQDIPEIQMSRNPLVSDIQGPSPKAVSGQEETYHISGVIPTGKNPTVIINDRVYRVGDAIDKKTIKKITRNQIVLTDGISDIVLSYRPE